MLAGLTVTAVGVLISIGPAQAAAPPAPVVAAQAVVPTTTSNGARTLVVDSTTDLPVSNATIAVQGKGFDTATGLYVAVCADSSGAPVKLTNCVGGAIPDANTTTGWAHITTDGNGPGGVKAAWGPDGSFSVTLALPDVAQGDVNCVTSKCSLYTASDDAKVRTEDNAVPVTFAAPPPTSSSVPVNPTTPTTPTTATTPAAPGTATVQNIATPDIEAGKTQLVIFSGFAPKEQVNLTLFSAPITLSPVTADATGVAQARFVVPADIAPGTHRLEAIGQQSRTVGVASFQVTAPPPPATASSTPSTSASPSTTASSSSPGSSSASRSAPASSAVTSSAVAPGTTDSGSSLWWLWLIIGIVVLAAIITGIVVYRRNKEQQQREQDEQAITDAAAREQAASSPADAPTVFLPPVRPGGPPPGEDPYGLLSGRDHPDSPTLYSGQDPGGPTQVIGPPDYDQGRGPYGQPLGQTGPGQNTPGQDAPSRSAQGRDLPTEALRPPSARPAGGPDGTDGPHTEAWTPDEDDSEPPERPDAGGPAGR